MRRLVNASPKILKHAHYFRLFIAPPFCSGTLKVTAVPAPGALVTVQFPPQSASRCLMFRNPFPPRLPAAVNDFGTCLFANGSVCAGTGNPDVAVSSGAGFDNGVPHIFTFTRKRSTGLISLHVDGNLAGTNTGGVQTLTAPAQLVLGAQQTLLNYFTGDIAEVKIYNAALGDSDRMADETSLKCKYGLGAGTLPPAPGGLMGTAGNRQVQLGWNPVIGANTYNLVWATNLNGTYTPCAGGLTTNAFVHLAAVNGKTNYYQVIAVSRCGVSTNSAAAGVFLPLPRLGVSGAGAGALNLSWPLWASDWGLSSATNLLPPILWLPVTNAVVNTNGQFNVNLPMNASQQFYRLSSP